MRGKKTNPIEEELAKTKADRDFYKNLAMIGLHAIMNSYNSGALDMGYIHVTSELAKKLGMTPKKFKGYLEELGLIKRMEGCYKSLTPDIKTSDKGYGIYIHPRLFREISYRCNHFITAEEALNCAIAINESVGDKLPKISDDTFKLE